MRWTYPAEAASCSAARRTACDLARAHGADDEGLNRIALGVTEAVTNAVLHAYLEHEPAPDDIEVELVFEDEVARLVVRDHGLGVRPGARSLGLGLRLMAHAAEEFEVSPREGGGTQVRMTVRLRAGEPSGTAGEARAAGA